MNFVVRKEDILNNDYITKDFSLKKTNIIIAFLLTTIFYLIFKSLIFWLLTIGTYLIFRRQNIRLKYRYLEGSFKGNIEKNYLYLNSTEREVRINLSESKIFKEDDYIVIVDKDNFKVIIFDNELTDYKEFLKELNL